MTVTRAHPELRVVRDEPSATGGELGPAPRSLDGAFREYAPYVAAVGLRILGRSDDIEDLVQDVFLRVGRHLGDLRQPDALKSWLAVITVRLAWRRLRARRLRGFFGLDHHDYTELVDPSVSPPDRVLLAQLYRVLDRLPVEQRVAWALRHLEGESLLRVAELCNCSLATAKRRIAAAHRVLEEVTGDG